MFQISLWQIKRSRKVARISFSNSLNLAFFVANSSGDKTGIVDSDLATDAIPLGGANSLGI